LRRDWKAETWPCFWSRNRPKEGEKSAENKKQARRDEKISRHGKREDQKKQRLQRSPAFQQKQKTEAKTPEERSSVGCRAEKYPQTDTVFIAVSKEAVSYQLRRSPRIC
jgi:hypothetical protein